MTTQPVLTVAEILHKLNYVSGPDERGWYSAGCPFHQDVTPSFRIRASDGLFSCLSNSCNANGDRQALSNKVASLPDTVQAGPVTSPLIANMTTFTGTGGDTDT